MTDNLVKRTKPLGEQKLYHNLDLYSFLQIGEARTRPSIPARMACAAPLVGLHIGYVKGTEVILYVPPVPPTSGGHCEDIPDHHRELFFAKEGEEKKHDAPDRRDFLWGHYCHDCPVREACFEYAMSYTDWGIWAGTTEAERTRLRGKVQEQDKPKDLPKRAEDAIKAGKKRLRRGLKPLA